SARNESSRILRAAVHQRRSVEAWLLATWNGHRSERRRLGCAGERAHGELRSAQVQGAAERTDGDRPALPRRVDALCRAAAATEERDRVRQRRGELLHLGRSAGCAWSREEHADQHW